LLHRLPMCPVPVSCKRIKVELGWRVSDSGLI
jgi:hypothetical protein